MTGRRGPDRAWVRWGPALVVLAAIGFATLRPSPPPSIPLPMFCLVCGDLGGVDVVLNVILFVPLGAALAWAGLSWRRAALACVAVSLTIESLQFATIPGRDASVGDLLTNACGGWIGAGLAAHWRPWVFPTRRTAKLLVAGAAAALLVVLGATASLFRPLVPYMDTFGQWAPKQPMFEPFTGTVHDVRVNGMHVPYALVPQRDRFLSYFTAGTPHVTAEVTTGGPTSRLSAIARGSNSLFELFMLGQRGTALVFRTRLRVSGWKLRPPSVALDDALPAAGVRAVIEGGLTKDSWFVRVRDARGLRERHVPFSVSLGWTLLMPADRPLYADYRWLSALWMFGLALPAGFWSWRAARPDPGDPRRPGRDRYWLAVPPVAILIALTVIPAVAHFGAAHWSEWLASLAGVLAGWGLGAASGTRATA